MKNLYRMKKRELQFYAECLGLDWHGTVAQLRKRISYELYDKDRK